MKNMIDELTKKHIDKHNDMKEMVIHWLSQLPIEELGDVLMESGAFRNSQVPKEQVEDWMECVLDYDEYDGVDYVDVFVFPRNNDDVEF
jgi:hypothetical protein